MASFVIPGQLITSKTGYIRGHGAYTKDGADGTIILSSIAGHVERVNKLITVRSNKSRYNGEVGDLIIGRVAAVESKRWKIEINGQRDATLQLSSVTLPGGVQRMRTYEDQLQMRTLFTEHDLICAEVQNVNTEGVVSLHTRSLKYGKLENGQFTTVPAAMVKRLPQHYLTLPCGVDVIIGKNGYIWVTRSLPESWKAETEDLSDSITPLAETLQRLRTRHNNTPLSKAERLTVVRICNSIRCLRYAATVATSNSANYAGTARGGGDAQGGEHATPNNSASAYSISPDTIMSVYHRSLQLGLDPKALILPDNIALVTSHIN